MLLTKEITVTWNTRNKKRLINNGYTFTKLGDSVTINVNELSPKAHVEVEIKCDFCGCIFLKKYYTYTNSKINSLIDKDSCNKCKSEKAKVKNQLLYGVDYTFQSETVKEKIKKTNLEKYGVENVMQSDEVKNKHKNVIIEKYGVENISQAEIAKENRKKTFLERYGVEHNSQTDAYKKSFKETSLKNWGTEHPNQSLENKEKIKNTTNKKYGVDYYTQTKEYKEKTKKTNNIKYGADSPMQSKEIQEKTKNTMILKYGVENYSQTEEYKIKYRNTSLERYGVEHPMQNKGIRGKVSQSYYENGTVKTSSQQLEIFNMLKQEGYTVELNYPVSNVNLDVAIFIDNFKIDLEYDAWYWHKDQLIKDRRRDEFLKSKGWKVLRIKSNRKVSSLDEMQKAIMKLVNTNKTYTCITLDDWGEKDEQLHYNTNS